MVIKVFISWSGEQSRELASAIRTWLPNVLQFTQPYFTPEDIEKGVKWSGEISSKLEECSIGIICLTKENLAKPWILFEAGALSKNMGQSRVCPILFDVDTADFSGPLTLFQATMFNKVDIMRLVKTINRVGNEQALEIPNLDEVFEMWWPKLDNAVKDILAKPIKFINNKRTDREILEEILDLTRYGSLTRRSMIQETLREEVPRISAKSSNRFGSNDTDRSPDIWYGHHRDSNYMLEKTLGYLIPRRVNDSDFEKLVDILRPIALGFDVLSSRIEKGVVILTLATDADLVLEKHLQKMMDKYNIEIKWELNGV